MIPGTRDFPSAHKIPALVNVSLKLTNGKGTKLKMGRPNNHAGSTKFGKLINRQGRIRAGRVSNFSEIYKRA